MKIPHRRGRQAQGFTLVELLTVMTIIGILAGLVLGTFKFVQEKAARSRAEAEIKAMEAGLESYKADNGAYPDNSESRSLNAQANGSPSSYAGQNRTLYRALSGDNNLDRKVDESDGQTDIYGQTATPPGPKPKIYMEFKPNQIFPPARPNENVGVLGVIDPWGNYYGYSTANQGDPTKGYNPTFDVWSTAGGTAPKAGESDTDYRLRWIKNW